MNRWPLLWDDLRARGPIGLLGVAIALLFVPALVTGWRAQKMAADEVKSEGFLTGVAAAMCKPEDVLPGLLSRALLADGPANETLGGLGITRDKFATDAAEFERWTLVAEMSLRQHWRERGEPCDEAKRDWIYTWRPSEDRLPTSYADARKVLGNFGCPRTDDEREDVWYYGGRFDVSTTYLEQACTRSRLARDTFRATAAGALLAFLGLTVFAVRHSSTRSAAG